MQEIYFANAAAALRRGYNVLVFDGPGQGECLIKHGLYMRPDWEKVITPTIDFLTARPDVDAKRIALFGESWEATWRLAQRHMNTVLRLSFSIQARLM